MPATTDYLPTRESDLVVWGNNFDAKINADPTGFGLTIAQAADFTTANTAWVAAFNAVNDNATRTPAAIQTKNTAKAAMVALARQLAQIIQKNPATTNTQRSELGLTVPDIEPTPVPIPSTSPIFEIISVLGQSLQFKLRDPAEPERRGKPDGVAGASIFAFIGETAPANMAEWQSMGNFTRTNGTLTFLSALVSPGSKVWLTASWFNPRGQQGPLSSPQSVYLAGGLSQSA